MYNRLQLVVELTIILGVGFVLGDTMWIVEIVIIDSNFFLLILELFLNMYNMYKYNCSIA